jgi:transcriptional regulator GlxA family with amidase domain
MAGLKIGILATPGVQLLDVSGPLDVFAEANVQAGREVYRPMVVGVVEGPIPCSSGARLLPDLVVGQAEAEALDTLLIAGAPNLHRAARDERLLDWIRATSAKTRRFGSVCTGAFLLAEAGLLDGHRATTHWSVADRLAERFPAVRLDIDAIHVRDGRLRTAAGVTAGLDLALALVEEDMGSDIARRVASQLVMFFRRGGGQLQYSRSGEGSPAGRSALQEVQRWVTAHPDDNHSVDALAGRAGLSPRHFARLFRHEVGITPSAWVEKIRVEAARSLLEAGDAPKHVAAACGFSDVDTLRRAFARLLGVTPAEYRRRHATVAS